MFKILSSFNSFLFSWLKKQWRLGLCRCCGSSNKVEQDPEGDGQSHVIEDYLERERNKEPLGDFTLSEYNEKGIKRCCNNYCSMRYVVVGTVLLG